MHTLIHERVASKASGIAAGFLALLAHGSVITSEYMKSDEDYSRELKQSFLFWGLAVVIVVTVVATFLFLVSLLLPFRG